MDFDLIYLKYPISLWCFEMGKKQALLGFPNNALFSANPA